MYTIMPMLVHTNVCYQIRKTQSILHTVKVNWKIAYHETCVKAIVFHYLNNATVPQRQVSTKQLPIRFWSSDQQCNSNSRNSQININTKIHNIAKRENLGCDLPPTTFPLRCVDKTSILQKSTQFTIFSLSIWGYLFINSLIRIKHFPQSICMWEKETFQHSTVRLQRQ